MHIRSETRFSRIDDIFAPHFLGATCDIRSRKEQKLQQERSALKPSKRSLKLSKNGLYNGSNGGKRVEKP